MVIKLNRTYILQDFERKYGLSTEILRDFINDLKNHRGETIIYAGNILSEEVHIAVNYLNELLGNTKLLTLVKWLRMSTSPAMATKSTVR